MFHVLYNRRRCDAYGCRHAKLSWRRANLNSTFFGVTAVQPRSKATDFANLSARIANAASYRSSFRHAADLIKFPHAAQHLIALSSQAVMSQCATSAAIIRRPYWQPISIFVTIAILSLGMNTSTELRALTARAFVISHSAADQYTTA